MKYILRYKYGKMFWLATPSLHAILPYHKKSVLSFDKAKNLNIYTSHPNLQYIVFSKHFAFCITWYQKQLSRFESSPPVEVGWIYQKTYSYWVLFEYFKDTKWHKTVHLLLLFKYGLYASFLGYKAFIGPENSVGQLQLIVASYTGVHQLFLWYC